MFGDKKVVAAQAVAALAKEQGEADAAKVVADAATADAAAEEKEVEAPQVTFKKETKTEKAAREAHEAKVRAEALANSEDFIPTEYGDKGWFKVCLGYRLAHPYQNKVVNQDYAVELEHDDWVVSQLREKLIRQVAAPK